jgi:hypothetical protein
VALTWRPSATLRVEDCSESERDAVEATAEHRQAVAEDET